MGEKIISSRISFQILHVLSHLIYIFRDNLEGVSYFPPANLKLKAVDFNIKETVGVFIQWAACQGMSEQEKMVEIKCCHIYASILGIDVKHKNQLSVAFRFWEIISGI